MSIVRMKRLWAITEPDRVRPLLDYLSALEAVHLVEAVESPSEAPVFSKTPASATDLDGRIVRLTHTLEIMNAVSPPLRSFGENFISFPLEVTAAEMTRALGDLCIEALDEQVTALADEALALRHRMEEIHLELRHLTTWARLDCHAPTPFRSCVGWLGTVTARARGRLAQSDRAKSLLVLHELGRGKDNRVLLQVVALKEDREEAETLLRDGEFADLPLPAGASVRDAVRAHREELTRAETRLDAVETTLKQLAKSHRRDVTAVLGWHEMRRDVLRSEEKSLRSKRMALVTGYARERDTERLAKAVAQAFPETGLHFDDPAPQENVPVEIRTNRLVAPAQFLVSMFGLPGYRAFDPSPFIMLNFLLFFGFCFGDVIYGIGLIVLGLYIARRVKAYPGLYNFFLLLAWGGFSAMIVGALTGSWAADLPAYFGKDNWLQKLRDSMCLLDMMEKPVAALVVALGIGVLNQLYGIVMKIYMESRRGDWKAALFDGGLWLLVLPGLILLVTPVFLSGAPSWLTPVGASIGGAGAVGLVLTQGRNEKSFLGKAIFGFVSLYGILGSYGATAFIGDTLSYCRLLALGLTTSIVGMCFNIISGLARDIPVGGLVAFTLVLLVGHVFNFLISILGAFVHSARLIFLEFFGRFYEIGGLRFQPLGTSERVRVVDKP